MTTYEVVTTVSVFSAVPEITGGLLTVAAAVGLSNVYPVIANVL
jgi:hypothetical protein